MITSYLGGISVGDRHVSRARTVTETDLVSLAMVTGDWHPIHVETEVTAIEPRDDQAGVVTSAFTVRDQRGRDVLVASLKSLVAEEPR